MNDTNTLPPPQPASDLNVMFSLAEALGVEITADEALAIADQAASMDEETLKSLLSAVEDAIADMGELDENVLREVTLLQPKKRSVWLKAYDTARDAATSAKNKTHRVAVKTRDKSVDLAVAARKALVDLAGVTADTWNEFMAKHPIVDQVVKFMVGFCVGFIIFSVMYMFAILFLILAFAVLGVL